MYLIRNVTNGNVFAGNVNLAPGASTNVSTISSQLALAISRGQLSSTPPIPSTTASLLVDQTTGTASNTLIAVPATYTPAQLANALASLIATANANANAIATLQANAQAAGY